MKENQEFPRRGGVGCPSGNNGGAEEFDLLPPMQAQPSAGLQIGRVSFDRHTILNSPCFWILVGAGLTFAGMYMTRPRRDK